jgi:hypothetical protein
MINMRSKGALPVPYIVAIIIAVIVIAVLVYWFFVLSGKGSTTATDSFCRAREFTYCAQWATSSFDLNNRPGKNTANPTDTGKSFAVGDNSYAPECKDISWAGQVGQAECRSLLGQPAQTPSSSATATK